MSKKEQNITSVRLDEDVDEYRQKECDNFSALVNDLVREYKDNGVIKRAIREFRKDEIKGNIRSLKAQLESEKTQLDEIESEPDPKTTEYMERLDDMKMMAPDPQSDPIKDIASDFGKKPIEVAEDLADEYNKEVIVPDEINY